MSDVYIRLPDELHKAIKEIGKKNHRSMNGEIVRALEYYVQFAPEAQIEKPVEEVKSK